MNTGELKHEWEKKDAITWLRLIAGHLAKIDRSLTGICSQVTSFKEERGKIPHTPLKEKGETRESYPARARKVFTKPTVEEVAAYIREKGYAFDAEEFWNYYESKGWYVGSHVMRSWRSACVTWQKKRERDAAREAARTAHIDAKMDERERKRTESRSAASVRSAPRRPDNWIPATEKQIKDFCDVFKG